MPSGHYSIGEVLSLLQADFPDVTISKIRFLESQGLIDPERTPSGYRRFLDHDLERLRWILVQQRDHYLPLKVIRERLEAGEPFAEPPPPARAGEVADDDVADSSDAIDPAGDDDHDGGSGSGSGSGDDGDSGGGSGSDASYGPPPGTSAGTDAAPPDAQIAPAAGAPAGPSPAEGRFPLPPDASSDGPDPATRALDDEVGRPPYGGVDEPTAVAPARAVEPEPQLDAPGAADGAAGRPPVAEGGDDPHVDAGAQNAPAVVNGRPSVLRPRDAEPAEVSPGAGPTTDPSAALATEDVTYTRDELSRASGCSVQVVHDLERFGLLHGRSSGSAMVYDQSSLAVAKLAARFAAHGLEPRHLRSFRLAADREIGLFAQVVGPLLQRRDPAVQRQALQAVDELVELAAELHRVLLRDVAAAELGPR